MSGLKSCIHFFLVLGPPGLLNGIRCLIFVYDIGEDSRIDRFYHILLDTGTYLYQHSAVFWWAQYGDPQKTCCKAVVHLIL